MELAPVGVEQLRHLGPSEFGSSLMDANEWSVDIIVRDGPTLESTLIHELLHLRLIPFSDGDQNEDHHEAREVAINLLADCFLRAYPKTTWVKSHDTECTARPTN